MQGVLHELRPPESWPGAHERRNVRLIVRGLCFVCVHHRDDFFGGQYRAARPQEKVYRLIAAVVGQDGAKQLRQLAVRAHSTRKLTMPRICIICTFHHAPELFLRFENRHRCTETFHIDGVLFDESEFRRISRRACIIVAVHQVLADHLRHDLRRQIHGGADDSIFLPCVISNAAAESRTRAYADTKAQPSILQCPRHAKSCRDGAVDVVGVTVLWDSKRSNQHDPLIVHEKLSEHPDGGG